MRNYISILIITVLLGLSSCGGDKKHEGTSADVANKEAGPPQGSGEKSETNLERKIIKEGQISFESSDANETRTLITKTVEELNAYISKDEATNYSGGFQHKITIRVQANKFDLLLKKISESAEKLDSKNIEVLDVTEEYIDVETRIKTKLELENRYKEVLKQATKVEEILTIEKEIGLLRSEIEAVEGKMKYLKDRIAFSTLTVNYYQRTSSSFGFGSKFTRALAQGWEVFQMVLIALTHLWIFILLTIVFVFVYRKFRKKKKQQ